MYPFYIRGQNVILTHLKPSLKNATLLSRVISENAAYLNTFFSVLVQCFNTPQDALNLLQLADDLQKNNGMLPYYIFKNGHLIGEINAMLSKKEDAEVSYWLDKKHTGYGYMTESLSLMEKALFNGEVKNILLYIDATNWRSADIATRAGYHLSNNTQYYFKTKYMWQESRQKIAQNASSIRTEKFVFYNHAR